MQIDLSKNYFELFGFPVSFDIDAAALRERYRTLQSSVHPDKFANAAQRERRLSVQHAALINEAHQTLKDPLARARYLLGLHGVAVNDESNTVMDPAFLMEQMELREAIAEVREQADPETALAALLHDLDGKLRDMQGELAQLLADVKPAALERAHTKTLQLQFLYRLREEAQAMEDELAG